MFKTELGVALTQCVVPAAQSGNYSARDANQSTDLLLGKCQRPWIAWVTDCVNRGGTKETCIKQTTNFAQAAIEQLKK